MNQTRRGGRPGVGRKVQVRPGNELLARLDAWATEHQVTRAEAIRRLLAQALSTAR